MNGGGNGGYEIRWAQALGLVLILGLALGLVDDAHASGERRV
jgi:hypothetical protein